MFTELWERPGESTVWQRAIPMAFSPKPWRRLASGPWAVWRLENGRAVLVGYRIFAGPDGKEARLPGVKPRWNWHYWPGYWHHYKLRACRAIELLERLATPEARALLEKLAEGAPGAFVTVSAQAALERLR
jgi:hypothetical protein